MQIEKTLTWMACLVTSGLRRAGKKYCNFFEEYCWLFLLLAFLPGFLINHPRTAVNIYRLLVFIPSLVYCALRPSVFSASCKHWAAYLFVTYTVYCFLTLLWGTNEKNTDEILAHGVATYNLFLLVFLVLRDKPQKLFVVEKNYLFAGTICLALAYFDSNQLIEPMNLNIGYGIFNHHVYIAWLAGSLCLLLLAREPRLSLADSAAFCFYFATIIFSHGRGGLIVFTAGYLCMVFCQQNPMREKQVLLCVVITLCLIFLICPRHLEKMISKELNMRPTVWYHGYQKVTHDIRTFIFGAGLNADSSFPFKNFIVPHYHSLYWSQLYFGGVVAFMLFLAMLFAVIKQGLTFLKENPWFYILVGMSTALIVDGDHFFRYPSPFFTCFLLPFFITLFGHRLAKPQPQNL